MQKYYIYRQKSDFAKTYQDAKKLVNSDSENIMSDLSLLSSNSNINMIISDKNFVEIYASTNLLNSSTNAQEIKNILIKLYHSMEIPEDKGYNVRTFSEPNTGTVLALMGNLTDKYYIFLMKPMIPMIRSVTIYQEFILFVSVLMALLSAVVAFVISSKFSKPIYELVDISERIANLDFSKKYVPKGSGEINQLGISLNTMSDKLSENIVQLYKANTTLKNDITQKERNEDMRKEFLQNASHELKTPIAVISSYSEMLKDKIITDEEDREYYYNVIYDETEKMGRIVKELLMLAQFESRSEMLNIEKFNITEVVEDVLSTYDIIAKKQNINIIVDIENDVFVSADMLMIERAMSNYISNAIYHAEGDDTIYVYLKTTPDGIRFSTKNKTPDILDNKKIWNSFYKSEDSHGNGLGLSIVKAIMDSHNKKYGVKCENGYAEFYFIL